MKQGPKCMPAGRFVIMAVLDHLPRIVQGAHASNRDKQGVGGCLSNIAQGPRAGTGADRGVLNRAQVQDEAFARVRVLFEVGANQGYQFKTHPNIDKQLYASNVLGLKDSDRPFPTGSALPILKWRMQVRQLACLLSRFPGSTCI